MCGAGGEYYNATAQAEVYHFTARAIWALHRLRIALCAMDRTDRGSAVSALIHELESLMEDTNPGTDS